LTIVRGQFTIEVAWQAVLYLSGLVQSPGVMTRGFCLFAFD